MRPRWQPYTPAGIRRVPCSRCGKPSEYQWQICIDGNAFHGICPQCDLDVNALVARFMCLPKPECLIRRYRNKVEAAVGRVLRDPMLSKRAKTARGSAVSQP